MNETTLIAGRIETYDPDEHTATIRPAYAPSTLLPARVLHNLPAAQLDADAPVLLALFADAGAIVIGPWHPEDPPDLPTRHHVFLSEPIFFTNWNSVAKAAGAYEINVITETGLPAATYAIELFLMLRGDAADKGGGIARVNDISKLFLQCRSAAANRWANLIGTVPLNDGKLWFHTWSGVTNVILIANGYWL